MCPVHLRMLLLVHEDPVDSKNSVSVPEASLLCRAALLDRPDQVAVGVPLDAQVEAVALPFLLTQPALSGAEGGGHFCDESQTDRPVGGETEWERDPCPPRPRILPVAATLGYERPPSRPC